MDYTLDIGECVDDVELRFHLIFMVEQEGDLKQLVIVATVDGLRLEQWPMTELGCR